jgi:hypothetical protein
MLGRLITAKECVIYTLWRPVVVAMDDNDRTRKHSGRGVKAPRQRRQRRRCTSRGTRGGRCKTTQSKGKRPVRQQVPSTPNHQRASTALAPRNGSRKNHFLKGYEKSVQRGKELAKQIMDIKYRAEQRRVMHRVPLPPRAAAGLQSRQHRIVAMSRRWGDAWSRANGKPGGRVSWRLEVFRASFVRDDYGSRDQESIFPGTDFTLDSQNIVEPEPLRPEHRAMWRFCPKCGSRHFADMRTCVNCIRRGARY